MYDPLTNWEKLMRLKYVRTVPDAVEPVRATEGAACFDLHATHGDFVMPGESVAFDTGLAFEVPRDHVMLVFSRSGHGFKAGVRLANGTGVIDSDYRGSVVVKLHNDGSQPFTVHAGDRVAQFLVLPVPALVLQEVVSLDETARGAGGFGSTS